MSDRKIIYLDDALCALRDEFKKAPTTAIRAMEVLRGLPSVQPDLDEWCTDCKEYDHERHSCPRWNRVIKETLKDLQEERKTQLSEEGTTSDCISRQAAIDVVKKWFKEVGLNPDVCIDGIISLPSQQPEPIRINLNEPIKVKLTDWGKEIYYHQYDRTNHIAGRKICKPKFPKEDENGYAEFQLWCFVELYGEHMGMTMPNVIEPLEIVYER